MTDIAGNLPLLTERGEYRDSVARPSRVPFKGAARWLQEPLLHFLLLGGALFLVSDHLEQRSRITQILITRDAVRGMAENYRLQYGRDPTSTQLDALIEGYEREEVFYHEAQKLGLDQDDEIVRRRLVQKYEFLQQDLALASDPTEAEVQAYFGRHRNRYALPPTVAFSHVYFSSDRRGDSAARSAADSASKKLNAVKAVRGLDQGDAFSGPQEFPGLSVEDAERVFGKGTLTAALFSLAPGEWSAPLRSAYGWHVVRVDDYSPSQPARFDAVKDQVRRDLVDEIRSDTNAAHYTQLKRNFKIVRE